jgi:hypothetical protein
MLEGVLPNNLLQIEPYGVTVIPPDPYSNTQRIFVPRTALVAVEVLGVVGELVQRTRGWDGHPRHLSTHPCSGESTAGVCVQVPARLLATLDRLAAASELFWDDAGKARPLEVEVTPRPFTLAGRAGVLPELVRMTVGEASVFYFNQRPKRTALALDWTRDQVASLSVQIADDGPVAMTPPALVAAGSPWSFFHLLERAERRGSTYTWKVRLGPAQTLSVSYDVVDASLDVLGGREAVADGRLR